MPDQFNFTQGVLLEEMIGRIGRIVLRPKEQVRYVIERSPEGWWSIRQETLDACAQVVGIIHLTHAETEEWTHNPKVSRARFLSLEDAAVCLGTFYSALREGGYILEVLWATTNHIVFPRSVDAIQEYSLIAVHEHDGQWSIMHRITDLSTGLVEKTMYLYVGNTWEPWRTLRRMFGTLAKAYTDIIRTFTSDPDRTTGT